MKTENTWTILGDFVILIADSDALLQALKGFFSSGRGNYK